MRHRDRQGCVGVPQEFEGRQVVGAVTNGRLEKREALDRGDPRNLGRPPQVSRSPTLRHAHVTRGLASLVLGHQAPVEVQER